MIRIEQDAWTLMADHAKKTYPNECCGAMLGKMEGGQKVVTEALVIENAFTGEQGARYEIRPEDLIAADKAARSRGLDLIGIFHSHPDCDAYFSKTDLENSCPWYSFVVISVKHGAIDHANSFLPDPDQTRADKEDLQLPASSTGSPVI